jgi:hypothetical protein
MGHTNSQASLTVWKVVINRVVLCGKLLEEQLGQIRNALVFVLQTLGHLSELALHFDHPVENKMRQNHEGVFLDRKVVVGQPVVQAIAVFVDHVVETNGHVSEGDYDVALDDWVSRSFHNLEEQHEVRLAELGANTHQLA